MTGALAGVIAGAMAGWVAGSQQDVLSPPSNWAILGPQLTATFGAALGLALGAIVGWLIGLLGKRRHVGSYVRAVEDGDLLLVITLEEGQLRPTEALLSELWRVRPARSAVDGSTGRTVFLTCRRPMSIL